MILLTVIVILVGMLSFVVLILMLRDVEVHKEMFRRYVRQIEKMGCIEKKVKWWEMSYSLFVRSGWLYRLPDENERPDLYSYVELRVISSKIDMNYRIIPWVAVMFGVCVGLLYWILA